MFARSKCSFSIDHILNEAGSQPQGEEEPPVNRTFDWVNCTRYQPPRLNRPKKEGVQRRNAGRNPRIPFSSEQVALLENKFQQTPYLSSSDVAQLATCLQLSTSRVKIWFQNRRARERRERDSQGDAKTNNTTVQNKSTLPSAISQTSPIPNSAQSRTVGSPKSTIESDSSPTPTNDEEIKLTVTNVWKSPQRIDEGRRGAFQYQYSPSAIRLVELWKAYQTLVPIPLPNKPTSSPNISRPSWMS